MFLSFSRMDLRATRAENRYIGMSCTIDLSNVSLIVRLSVLNVQQDNLFSIFFMIFSQTSFLENFLQEGI